MEVAPVDKEPLGRGKTLARDKRIVPAEVAGTRKLDARCRVHAGVAHPLDLVCTVHNREHPGNQGGGKRKGFPAGNARHQAPSKSRQRTPQGNKCHHRESRRDGRQAEHTGVCQRDAD